MTRPGFDFACKPDFDECLARIYAWCEQTIIDRPPVRFHHHNIEYERHRTVAGPWVTAEDLWEDMRCYCRGASFSPGMRFNLASLCIVLKWFAVIALLVGRSWPGLT